MKRTAKKAIPAQKRRTVYPSPINNGDIIGVVAPAGSLINKENFFAGVKLLEKKGFRVRFNRKILTGRGYLAGTDQERADEFNRMWADPEVKALVAARGGYGCLRMIDQIDVNQIRKNPKILIGFSDLTVLLNTINQRTRLVTFHGPVLTTLADIDRYSKKSIFDTLLGQAPTQLTPAGLKIIKGGKAKGILMGGNLTTLAYMTGTPYEIPWQDAILFIEDIGEKAYSLDRLLTYLYKTGRLQKIKGLILGTFSDEDRKEKLSLQKAVNERIAELLGVEDIPVWANFPTGHSRRNITLPVGAEVEMDSSALKLSLYCKS
jgi:muramoyltetrapeptide carboxypeptidase